MTTQTSRRKPNSIFDEQVKAINSFEIGTIYKVADMRNRMKVGKHNTERVGDYHLDLLSTNCIERVKHGQYRVLGHIPDFLTLNMCESNRGYDTTIPNPEFIGFTNKKNDPSIEFWYVDNILPYKRVPRGKKWKLGEPNPFIQKEETIEVPKSTIGEFKEKVNLFFSVKKPGEYLTAHTIYGTIVIIITIHSDPDYVLVKYDEEYSKESMGSFLMRFGEFTSIEPSYSFSAEPESSKKELIVNILKQGLSASDAADLILKLI